ncbi:MAG: N-6 DNA methylase [Desulfococcaceae bacterium]
MTQYRHREETVNAQLAVLLARHGVSAEAETVLGQQRPDVMFMLGGLRVIIEGKFSDTSDADNAVKSDAFSRVKSGICHIAVALVYPKNIRTAATSQLEKILSSSSLRFLIISETGLTEWAEATPAGILSSLRHIHGTLIKDDIVAKSARQLSERIEVTASLWIGLPAVCDRLSDRLGMPVRRRETADEQEARRVTATKVASLVLANAMIFQEQLASHGDDSRIVSLRAYDTSADPVEDIKSLWHRIWTEINYVPIFKIGSEILQEIPVSQSAISAVRRLMSEAKSICANQSALRHDLMGRIYHWLLYHSKYLGTYYTATSSATLLLKLVFAQKWEGQDFGSLKKLSGFAVADLACGTGTLLMAAAQAVTDQFVVSCVEKRRKLSDAGLGSLHKILMENVMYGYDVLPTAVHLTASTLGMLAPSIAYRSMNLFVMPMGVPAGTKKTNSLRLGSLDFIDRNGVDVQFSLHDRQMTDRQTGVAAEHDTKAVIPNNIDLFVMNPPFVRSVGGNLLFGSLPEDERTKLQTELKKRSKDLQSSVTAGLGSVFLALADKYLRTGGRLAFILPVALAAGEAWGKSRKLLADGYHVEVIMVSHDADRPNFSENTDLSEIMFIARKRKENEKAGETVYVNLWHNPRTIYEAMDVAERVRNCKPAPLDSAEITSAMALEGRKLAEVVSLPATLLADQWIGVQFAQTLTLRAAVQLEQGKLAVPGKKSVDVPLCKLADIGKLGPDRKRIHEGFKPSETDWSPFPSFWNHDAKKVVRIRQKPNTHLMTWAESPRGSDYGERRLWPRAGRILLVERLWPITHRVIAVGFDEPVLGNTWWALKTELTAEQEKILLLWLNSTPSLLLFLSRRVATRSAWMMCKQPAWESMSVLDVRSLPDKVITQLAEAYDAICNKELKALAGLDADPVRAEIDDALSRALGLPDIKPLRQLLAREPGLTGKGLSPKPGQVTDEVHMEDVSVQTRLI